MNRRILPRPSLTRPGLRTATRIASATLCIAATAASAPRIAQAPIGQPAGPALRQSAVRPEVPPSWTPTDEFESPVLLDFAQFGASIALNGDLVLVGASALSQTPYFAAGGAFLYERDITGRWHEREEFSSGIPNEFGFFGSAVALADDFLCVGSPGTDTACPGLLNCGSGAVTFYERSGSNWVRQPEVIASDAEQLDHFGSSLALWQDTLIVGAPDEGNTGPPIGNGNGQGAVYVLRRLAPGNYVEAQKLLPPAPIERQQFGFSVAIEGDRMVVGSPFINGQGQPGQVHVYREVGGVWTHEAQLTPSTSAPDDLFGWKVSLVGSELAVGAPGSEEAFVFEDLGGGSWVQQQRFVAPSSFDLFGQNVALTPGRLVICAPLDPHPVRSYRRAAPGAPFQLEDEIEGPLQFGESGLALAGDRLLVGDLRDTGDGTWQLLGSVRSFEFDFVQPDPVTDAVTQVLVPNAPTQIEVYGTSIARSGDTRLAVAGGNESAVVYGRVGDQWRRRAYLEPPVGSSTSFGSSIDADGGLVAVGDMAQASKGVVHVWREGPGGWTLEASVVGSDITPGGPGIPQPSFGKSAALDGGTLLVGAIGKGAAYLFEESSGAWTEVQKLEPLAADSNDQFGWAVALDGDHAAVSAWRADDWFPDSGAVYTYERVGANWVQTQRLIPQAGSSTARFGASLDLRGSRLVVGANLDDTAAENAGSVYVYTLAGGNWVLEQHLFAENAAVGDRFGSSISLRGDALLVGADQADPQRHNSGAAYLFHRALGTWRQTLEFVANEVTEADQLGNSVCLIGGDLVASGARAIYVAPDEGPVPAPILSIHPRRLSPDELLSWEVGRGASGQSVELFVVAIDGVPTSIPVGLSGSHLDVSGLSSDVGSFDALGRWTVAAFAPTLPAGTWTFRAQAIGHDGQPIVSNEFDVVFE